MKNHLLASVSAAALAMSWGGAFAADLPIKAPAPVPYAWSWVGPYIGLHAGVVRSESKFWDTGRQELIETGTIVSDKTGFIGGAQIGYNWQSENLVYGVEADISGLDSNITTNWSVGATAANFDRASTTHHNIPWLATFRGRGGLAVGRTMVYVTGGLAVAETRDSAQKVLLNDGRTILIAKNETRVGWTGGFGLEHMLSPNWTVRGEVLYVDLGRGDEVRPSIQTLCTGCTYSGRFSHTLTLARVGVNLKW